MVIVSPIFNSFDVITNHMSKKGIKKQVPLNLNELIISQEFPNIKNKVILDSLLELNNVVFDSDDVQYMASMGIKIPFDNGAEIVKFLNEKNVNIEFGQISIKGIFAQYNYKDNLIVINENYKVPKSRADVLAISEAIVHESGHAFDCDSGNSVQEEINNLALNVLTHKHYLKKYPHAYDYSTSPLIIDGVQRYKDLFYDVDPEKKALVDRLKKKYGYLPLSDYLHPASYLAMRVKEASI